MKKMLALLLALVMVLSLVACGKAEAPAADAPADAPADVPADAPVQPDPEASYEGRTISMAFTSTEFNDAYLAQIAAFEEKYGCKVDVEILSSDSNEATNSIILRSSMGELPDIFRLSVGAVTLKLDPANTLVDLSGYDFVENISEAYIAAASDAEGHLYATPADTAKVAGVFYNKAVFNELGLEIPTTWDEFLDVCVWIRDNTDMDPVSNPFDGTAGKQIAFFNQFYYVHEENENWVDQYVAREMTMFDSPAWVRGLQRLEDMYELDIQNADPMSTSLEDSARAICDGTAAFVFCRTNILTSVMNVAPDKINDIGFFPLPDVDPNVRGVATWMPTGWHMAQTCEDKELAALLLEYLTTPEAVDVFCATITPTGPIMLKNVELPADVAPVVLEAQEWSNKAGWPVMEYFMSFYSVNLPDLLTMVLTGELTVEEAIPLIEADYELAAIQQGVWE